MISDPAYCVMASPEVVEETRSFVYLNNGSPSTGLVSRIKLLRGNTQMVGNYYIYHVFNIGTWLSKKGGDTFIAPVRNGRGFCLNRAIYCLEINGPNDRVYCGGVVQTKRGEKKVLMSRAAWQLKRQFCFQQAVRYDLDAMLTNAPVPAGIAFATLVYLYEEADDNYVLTTYRKPFDINPVTLGYSEKTFSIKVRSTQINLNNIIYNINNDIFNMAWIRIYTTQDYQKILCVLHIGTRQSQNDFMDIPGYELYRQILTKHTIEPHVNGRLTLTPFRVGTLDIHRLQDNQLLKQIPIDDRMDLEIVTDNNNRTVIITYLQNVLLVKPLN